MRHAKKIAALIVAVAVILFPQLDTTGKTTGKYDGQAVGVTDAGEFQGRVVGITDGDTLTLLVGGRQQVKIRLAEIDTPESGQPYGTRAKQELSSLAFNKEARALVKETDKYGRKVAHVLVDGVDVNAEMVKRGAAWVYRAYAWDPALYKFEEEAKSERLGLWALPESERVAPWEWRHEKRDTANRKSSGFWSDVEALLDPPRPQLSEPGVLIMNNPEKADKKNDGFEGE